MKSWLPVLTFLALSFVSNSCGPDGPDGNPGKAYLTVTTSYGILYAYSDNNTSRPGQFNQGQAYRVTPGKYDFEYESRIYNLDASFYYADWLGYYEIHINDGEKGGSGTFLFQRGAAGKDGLDNYLTLLCNFDGFTGARINKQQLFEPIIPDSSGVSESVVGDYHMKVTYRLVRSGISSGTSHN